MMLRNHGTLTLGQDLRRRLHAHVLSGARLLDAGARAGRRRASPTGRTRACRRRPRCRAQMAFERHARRARLAGAAAQQDCDRLSIRAIKNLSISVEVRPSDPTRNLRCATGFRPPSRGGQGAAMKFGIGQSVRRTEDIRFVTGQGQYTDDLRFENETHRRFRTQPAGACEDPQSIDVSAPRRPRRAWSTVLTHADVEAFGAKPMPLHGADQEPRRLARRSHRPSRCSPRTRSPSPARRSRW